MPRTEYDDDDDDDDESNFKRVLSINSFDPYVQ